VWANAVKQIGVGTEEFEEKQSVANLLHRGIKKD
jgi:hypothetical protein